jgi:hypothetical protein
MARIKKNLTEGQIMAMKRRAGKKTAKKPTGLKVQARGFGRRWV